MRLLLCYVLLIATLAGCRTNAELADPTPDRVQSDLQAMLAQSTHFGEGGAIVLTTAAEALTEAHAAGRNPDVELPDLWAHAIKEGSILFKDPSRRWGKTSAEETADMIGQTTIGPWQITIGNVKNKHGLPYGITPTMTEAEVYAFCRDHPKVQVWMIADLIQENYDAFGVRGPYSIQRYFWLEAYVKGEIGQGDWDKSVLPKAPGGDWRLLTPEMKADTGLYAKQLVCGTKTQPWGLLYWLAVTGRDQDIRDLLSAWDDQQRLRWDSESGAAVRTDEAISFRISTEDLKYLAQFPEAHARVAALVAE
jgi:hypothetical protein